MTERGTSYTAEIETPSGLTFHAGVYVPPDAEYDDQHELIDVANAGAARMVGMAARVARPPDTPIPLDCYSTWKGQVCALTTRHAGPHRTEDSGYVWTEAQADLPF